MKLSIRLIAALVVAISLVTFIATWNQVRDEKHRLRTDLELRGETLTEAIQPVLQSNTDKLPQLVKYFSGREHLMGIAVYDASGRLVTASTNLAQMEPPPKAFAKCKTSGTADGEFESVGSSRMYVYALPLHHDGDISGILVTLHDAGYIDAQSAQIWRDALWHVVAQILLIALITSMVIRWSIVTPITRVSQWMRDLRTGRVKPFSQPLSGDFLEPLTSEAANLARSLSQARLAAEKEAELRDAGDSLWTADRLRAGVRRHLRHNLLIVVSNREPYEHVHRGKGIEECVPASGLVTAVDPILCACDGTWIAHGSGDADHEIVDLQDRLRVPLDQPRYTLRRIWLTQEEERGYCLGFANEGIWPLCHLAHTRPIFRAIDWRFYQKVNERFAQAVLQEIEGTDEPFILIQDYHLALLPQIIKLARPNARVAIFWHIPWPNPQSFAICPWQREMLDGLLGADLIGFQLQDHCNHFLETVDNAVECRVEWNHFAVSRNSRLTRVRPHPISVAFPAPKPFGMTTRDDRGCSSFLKALDTKPLFLGVGVDRVDYTKGLIERFRAIEHFLDKYSKYVGKFTFVQFAPPTRTDIKRYKEFFIEVEREADRINTRFHANSWKPIIFRGWHHNRSEIEPYYKAAHLCMVTSLHDGMNLVAKEFVAAREDEDGVLILSKFAGACSELRDGLLVNPYDIEQLAETIRRALEMPPEERRLRMLRMRRIVQEHNVYRWAADLISDLAEIRLDAADLAGIQ